MWQRRGTGYYSTPRQNNTPWNLSQCSLQSLISSPRNLNICCLHFFTPFQTALSVVLFQLNPRSCSLLGQNVPVPLHMILFLPVLAAWYRTEPHNELCDAPLQAVFFEEAVLLKWLLLWILPWKHIKCGSNYLMNGPLIEAEWGRPTGTIRPVEGLERRLGCRPHHSNVPPLTFIYYFCVLLTWASLHWILCPSINNSNALHLIWCHCAGEVERIYSGCHDRRSRFNPPMFTLGCSLRATCFSDGPSNQ